MTINKKQEGTSLTVAPVGKLDTYSSREFGELLETSLNGIEHLILDFEQVDYITSAGLRVLLIAQKIMDKQGDMKLIHVSEAVLEVFEPTGFMAVLNIE